MVPEPVEGWFLESHVMQNKPQERTYHRKYVGILTEINDLNILFRCHLGKIVIDFKKVEEACRNYKK